MPPWHDVNGARSWQQPEHDEQTKDDERRTRQKKKPVRRVKQHKAQMGPAIAETAKMRRAAALVGPERDGNFRDARAKLCGLDHKLGGKLHSGAAKVHTVVDGARKSAHTAMTISDASIEKQI